MEDIDTASPTPAIDPADDENRNPKLKRVRKLSKPSKAKRRPAGKAKRKPPIPLSKRKRTVTSFTRALVKTMEKRGLSMMATSKRMRVSYGTVWALAQGIRLPNSRTAGKFAKFLGVSQEKLAAMGK